MKRISQFGTSTSAIIADLRRTVCDLEIDLKYAEDREQFLLARHLRARRDNLLLTISTLENHLNDPISLQGAASVLNPPSTRCRRRRPLAKRQQEPWRYDFLRTGGKLTPPDHC